MEVIQLNLNHCELAQVLLMQTMAEIRVDVALISDPYKVPPNNGNWVSDKAKLAAIRVCGEYPIQEIISNGSEGRRGKSHGEVYFFTTQCLSGHGVFRDDLYRIGKLAFFECPRFLEGRKELYTLTSLGIRAENLIEAMCRDKDTRDLVSSLIFKTLISLQQQWSRVMT